MTLAESEIPINLPGLGEHQQHQHLVMKPTSTTKEAQAAALEAEWGNNGTPEAAAADIVRPLSAPPPPGFNGGEDRSQQLIWGASGALPQPNHERNQTEEPSDSFSNLEAMLGKGLALSMEDAATKDFPSSQLEQQQQLQQQLQQGENLEGPNALNLNLHRQSRHASRLGRGAPLNGNHAIGGAAAHLFDSRLYARAGTQSSLGPSGFPSILSNPAAPPAPVSEPDNESQGHRSVPNTSSGQTNNSNGMGSDEARFASGMWTGAREFKPAAMQNSNTPEPYNGDALSAASSISDSNIQEITSAQAESELRPFLWDHSRNQPCRTLAILRVSWLRMPEVRASCESFGVLESFRADFFSKGICFVSYYDIRSAEYAAVELQSNLQRMVVAQGSNEEVVVRYCLPLNASSQFDESQIMIHDLPADYNEHTLSQFLTSYGATRSVIQQGAGSYIVEFHNMQDAKQALLELESSQPFGPNVTVEVGLRNPAERKRGRELLNMISRWRQGLRPASHQTPTGSVSGHFSRSGHVTPPAATDDWNSGRSVGSHRSHTTARSAHSAGQTSYPGSVGSYSHRGGDPQVVVGPDGRLMQVVMQQNPGNYHHQHQHVVHHPNGQMFLTGVPPGQVNHGGTVYVQQNGQTFPATVVSNSGYMDHRRQGGSTGSHYSGHYMGDGNSVGGMSGRSHRSGHSGADDRDNRLQLDLDAVESGDDDRTSLMVRNIPNKYTQQMLLSEFMENSLGPGVIDFFYLPIDFKNRCNRGYAFINFVDFKDILPFHQRYFGKHWRTFNSDKICDITYARIQGKSAMLKRFENSALMEKDDEYKPLVFVSDGPDKGKRLPFPDPSHHGGPHR